MRVSRSSSSSTSPSLPVCPLELTEREANGAFGSTIPIGGYVLQIIAMLFLGWWSDRTKWRARLIVLAEVSLASILCGPVPFNADFRSLLPS
jgi:sugar phosphate permease